MIEFANSNPWLTFFLALMVATAISTICNTAFRFWNRLIRHLNIRAQGWPPAHCDADGDFRPTDEVKV